MKVYGHALSRYLNRKIKEIKIAIFDVAKN